MTPLGIEGDREEKNWKHLILKFFFAKIKEIHYCKAQGSKIIFCVSAVEMV
jgi:hypothetical protein